MKKLLYLRDNMGNRLSQVVKAANGMTVVFNQTQTYDELDLANMRDGRPPLGPDGHPMELNHIGGNPNAQLQPMSRTDYRLGPNYMINHFFLRREH